MTRSANVKMKVGNYEFDQWSDIMIKKSMGQICSSFGFSTNEFSKGDLKRWKLKLGDEVKIYIEDTLVCTGWLESIPMSYDATTGHYIQFIGRGKTCDLVDCMFTETKNEWKNVSMKNIITDLCNIFNLSVTIDSTVASIVSKQITEYKANEGEYIYLLINDLCRLFGILPLDKGDGKLTLTRSTTSSNTVDSIDATKNVLKSFLYQDNSERYKTYKVKGCGNGAGTKQLKDYISPYASVTDSAIDRTRTYTVLSERATDNGKCEDRARYEARIRAGNSRGYLCEVSSFIQGDRTPWDINKLCRVKDDFYEIEDTLLISDVTFTMSQADSQKTTLFLVDKDTYSGSSADIDIKTVLG